MLNSYIAAVGMLSVIGTNGVRAAPACPPKAATAYVVNQFANTVTPINTATNTALKPIAVGDAPDAIAITPNGKTAYVINYDNPGLVTPISTRSNTALKPITVGSAPIAIAGRR